ncbi:MAG TPA: hypothetical protein VKE69_05675, partial [Planctomycetota bacterium]|nr:hypothetical protein [Planctomycetota bacterium]
MDGTALAYRSHHALSRSRLATSEGRPTAATYGFATTMRALIEKEKPDRIVVAFDTDAETPRHKELPTYKATREKAPDEIERALTTLGMRGVGEVFVRSLTNEVNPEKIAKDLSGIMRVAEKHGVPVQFPTAWSQFPGGLFYGDPVWA